MPSFARQLLGAAGSVAIFWFVSRSIIRTGGISVRGRPPFVALHRRKRRAVLPHVPAAAEGAPVGGLTVLPSEYPQVRRDDTVVEELHGNKIADPYRWLEDPDSAETKAFVEAQNKLTDKVLAECDTRDEFKQLMRQLYDYPKYGTPARHGDRYYYYYNTGLQAQSVLYSHRSLTDTAATVLIDPNKLSDDGTVALMGSAFSEDGDLFAYSLASGGSDWREVKFMSIDQATGEGADLPDKLEHVKFSSLAWTHDGKGVFYNRFEPPAGGSSVDPGTETDINLRQQLVYHVLGTSQVEDTVILAAPKDDPEWMLGAQVTDDGRYLLVSVSNGCEPVNRLWWVDLELLPRGSKGALDLTAYDHFKGSAQLPVNKLVDNFEAQYEYVANEGPLFTFMTNLDAPRYRVVGTDITNPGQPQDWSDIIPEHNRDLLQWAHALKGDSLVVCYLRDVRSALELRSLKSGNLRSVLPLPGIGSVAGFFGRRKDSEAFFKFTSFTEPGAIYRFDADLPGQEPQIFRRIKLNAPNVHPDDFVTRQEFFHSRDGTRVPMFIVHKKGVEKTGLNPTLLYGYGGFNISLEPGFSVTRLCFMLAYGGVYAVASLRGGGEYGREWRDAGSKQNKQNVFDDFQAAAEHVIQEGYCSPETLTIQGGSNGGLLVAACANQRPDLYAAVLAQVGVMDMLRFHKFTIGHAWCSDYGSPDDPEAFEWLYAYSPLHNVRRPVGGTRQYPAMLLTTGDHDDRVVPLHSHKLTATLQHTLAASADSPQTNPLITRVEVRAGHGAGKPTEKIIAEAADMMAFATGAMKAAWVGPTQQSEPNGANGMPA